MDLTPDTNWMPTTRVDETFARRLISVQRSSKSPSYDRVSFKRILRDGSLGEPQSSYVGSWNSWVRKFEARREDKRTAPAFECGAKGVQFFAQDSDGQWHYVNHAGTWQACPPPVST